MDVIGREGPRTRLRLLKDVGLSEMDFTFSVLDQNCIFILLTFLRISQNSTTILSL